MYYDNTWRPESDVSFHPAVHQWVSKKPKLCVVPPPTKPCQPTLMVHSWVPPVSEPATVQSMENSLEKDSQIHTTWKRQRCGITRDFKPTKRFLMKKLEICSFRGVWSSGLKGTLNFQFHTWCEPQVPVSESQVLFWHIYLQNLLQVWTFLLFDLALFSGR